MKRYCIIGTGKGVSSMAFSYNVKRDLTGHSPKCQKCGRLIKVEAKGIMRGGKRVFYHPSCFKSVKL